ncbi:LysR family transcriptional regulator [Pseudomonas sp. NPDC089554]|uniref:LysR family transcriptional regulator n=1 Tax=Pseudomonas sp. NPDC089554 TaxID=3390653 RepID=UPI003D000839
MAIDAELLQRIDLNSLLAFLLIYHEHSVSRAAEQLGITQPAVSNTLAKLRLHFGDPLFVRDGNALVPTPLAQHIAKELGLAFEHIQRCLKQARPSR